MRTFAVSDIHGRYDLLLAALKRANFTAGTDRLIIAGDMFDRGEQSFEIYSYVKNVPNIIPLMGNHELLLLNVLKRGKLNLLDLRNGIGATVKSFQRTCSPDWLSAPLGFSPQLLEELTTFIEKLPFYWEDEHFLITHSFDLYVNSYRQLDRNQWEKMSWANAVLTVSIQSELMDGVNGKTLLFGHWWASLFWTEFNNRFDCDEVWTSSSRKLIALDTCTNRSDYLGIVELLKNGEVKIW